MIFRTHYRLEKSPLGLAFAIVAVSAVGGLMEIAPLFTIDETVEDAPDMRVYTPLELAGRHLYMREGCYACHSQMIRTLEDEVERYGAYSRAVESQYDHPMLWGSKRTGPDLARVGAKYSDEWQVRHLVNPRALVPTSIMPTYGWLARNELDVEDMAGHLTAMRRVGVPYTDAMIANAVDDARGQADPLSEDANGLFERYGEDTSVRAFDGEPGRLTEMDAMVAYLQILGHMVDIDTVPDVDPTASSRGPAGDDVTTAPSDGVLAADTSVPSAHVAAAPGER